MDYNIYGVAGDKKILLYTANDKETAEYVANILRDFSEQRMLIKDNVYIHNVSIMADVEFNAYMYIDVNEVFNNINVDSLVKDCVNDSDVLIDAVSASDEEVGNLLQEYYDSEDASSIMQFITIHKDKIRYDEEESYESTLGYVVPCTFNVNAFLKEVEE